MILAMGVMLMKMALGMFVRLIQRIFKRTESQMINQLEELDNMVDKNNRPIVFVATFQGLHYIEDKDWCRKTFCRILNDLNYDYRLLGDIDNQQTVLDELVDEARRGHVILVLLTTNANINTVWPGLITDKIKNCPKIPVLFVITDFIPAGFEYFEADSFISMVDRERLEYVLENISRRLYGQNHQDKLNKQLLLEDALRRASEQLRIR